MDTARLLLLDAYRAALAAKLHLEYKVPGSPLVEDMIADIAKLVSILAAMADRLERGPVETK